MIERDIPNTLKYHAAAMDAADKARAAQSDGREAEARRCFRAAVEHACSAANEEDRDPIRYVLCRSAARLAIECGDWDSALRILKTAIPSDPTLKVDPELLELFERATKQPTRMTLADLIDCYEEATDGDWKAEAQRALAVALEPHCGERLTANRKGVQYDRRQFTTVAGEVITFPLDKLAVANLPKATELDV